MAHILIVEDERAIADLICMSLQGEGYRCVCTYDGQTAADAIEQGHFDLVLLDIMLPKIDGYELLEYLRSLATPVIFITAKSAVNDRIRGLRLGADDYITKPFQIGELSARVEAVLRRYGMGQGLLTFGGVAINTESRTVEKHGLAVELTAKEFDLLVELVRNKNVALRRDRLYERVWEQEFTGETRTLDSHIQRLRKKLGWEERIRTVFRIGYRLEG